MPLTQLIAVARGDAPADLVLRNGRIVNVFSGEIEQADIAICGERIAGVGHDYRGREEVDLAGAYVAPGLIDAHVHIESSLCLPAQFAAAVVPRGVTTVIADPHEIANVAGAAGVRFMADAARGLTLSVILMAPSCVPATDMATAGAALDAEQLATLLNEQIVHGLAEVMNYPGVIDADSSVLSKLRVFRGRSIDGHAPGVCGNDLSAYAAAGVGSDHECVSLTEAKEKLARGLYILIREASNARNLDALLPLVTPQNSRRICFCTDDRQPADLLSDGGIDHMLRRAIAAGVDAITAFRCCTLNPAEWFGLHDRGGIAPGRRADLFIFDDLNLPHAKQVFAAGRLVADGGRMMQPAPPIDIPQHLRNSVNIDWNTVDFLINAGRGKVRVIEAHPSQLITRSLLVHPRERDGRIVADVERDILKIAVIERHHASGRMGLGLIKGFGLKRGAIAGTVAHDHHNLIIIGADDESMMAAAQAAGKSRGGYAVAEKGQPLMVLGLPIAGLMTDEPIEQVAREYDALLQAARSIGATMPDPFMAMSFMALEVIPSLKLTDRGLVDVEKFEHVDLFA
jgi:adenine deaminase